LYGLQLAGAGTRVAPLSTGGAAAPGKAGRDLDVAAAHLRSRSEGVEAAAQPHARSRVAAAGNGVERALQGREWIRLTATTRVAAARRHEENERRRRRRRAEARGARICARRGRLPEWQRRLVTARSR
jgi:hypothetical protein